MSSRPQYCYIISMYLAAKLHDLTYPACRDFLVIAQRFSHLLKCGDTKSREGSFFESALVDFVSFEEVVMREL